MENLADQTIVITGGGAGIGQALALGFVRCGAYVVAIARGTQGLEQTRRLCEGPGKLECHALDVADGAALEALLGNIVKQRGGLDVLINGAAVYPRTMLKETSPEDWAAGVATNLNGIAYGCRGAVRTCPDGHPLLIFNVGTFAHLGPEPASTLYCGTKAAVSAFTRALAVELASMPSRVVVNEWVPGVYRTRMSGYTGEDPAVAFTHFLEVLRLARLGPGGRLFAGSAEILPQRSLRSRLKSFLLGGRK